MVFKGAVSKKTGRIGLITTDEVRLHGFELNLALEGKVSAELTDELHFVERSEV